MNDLKFALRQLVKNPGFTLVAVLTLALGIGANTTIFTIAYGVLLKPLPLPRSERLVNVWERGPGGQLPRTPVSAQNYLDWKVRAKSFSALTCFQSAAINVGADKGAPERWSGAAVHDDFFKVVGVNPALGNAFSSEHFNEGTDGVVILGHGAWQERFGGDARILGRTISLNGRSRTVIGIMPAGFQTPGQSRVWVPKVFSQQELFDRGAKSFVVLGRLADDTTVARATSEVGGVAAGLARDFPEMLEGWSAFAVPLLEGFAQPMRLPLLVLLAAVGVVLLMACVNVTNLLLARSASRAGEMAVRVALGAGHRHLMRQLGVENLLLAALGGVTAWLLAAALLKLVIATAPAGLPRLNQVTLDLTALAFTSGAALLTSFVFGFAPAWQLARVDPVHTMRDSAVNTTVRAGGVGQTLAVFQIAAAMVVLIATGLLLRSFDRLLRTDLGFRQDQLLTVRLELPPAKYGAEGRRNQFARSLLEKLAVVPGVERAAGTTRLPLQGWPQVITRVEGRPSPRPGEAPATGFAGVTPDYFRALSVPILRGRSFTASDHARATRVGVINEAFARRFFPGEEALGRRIELGFDDPPRWIEIVGVARDARNESLEGQPQEEVFIPLEQTPGFFGTAISVAIRTQPAAPDILNALRQAVWSIDPDQALHNLKPMKQILVEAMAQRRFTLMVLGLFAALALLLTLVGLYGVLAHGVARRGREIGIRMALGAQRGNVQRLILRQGLRLATLGILAGSLGALATVRLLRSLLYGTAPADPMTFVAITILLALVSLLACWLPARRASRVDPMQALRYE